MYDILQLNDMLVPELQDIAEQFDILNFKKSDKQELIFKILDKQAIMNEETKDEGAEKPKRKRIPKPVGGPHASEEIKAPEEKLRHSKKAEVVPEKRKPLKKADQELQPQQEEEELQPITSEQSTIPPLIASLLQQEDEADIQQGQENQQFEIPQQTAQPLPKQQYQQRRDTNVFNIEFDGII
jgi:transcription termination factor Rho